MVVTDFGTATEYRFWIRRQEATGCRYEVEPSIGWSLAFYFVDGYPICGGGWYEGEDVDGPICRRHADNILRWRQQDAARREALASAVA